MSGLRGRSAVAADHRSVLPQIPGMPWWAAAIVACALAALGFAFDASTGSQSLDAVFAACYAVGCVLAVLAVRQSGVFTAVIQPPLILFGIVPIAYFVFHGSTFTGIKDMLINCGYPLIERFPLMFYTSAAVLVIGLIRWLLGAAARRAVPEDAELVDQTAAEVPAAKPASPRRTRRAPSDRPGRAAAATASVAAADAVAADASTADVSARPPRRSTRTPAPAAQRSSSAEAGARRSRQPFPPEADTADAASSRPRRRSAPPVDSPVEPRRRPRSNETRDRREPRDRRQVPPVERRSPYERTEHSERPQRRERPEPFERIERPQRRERPEPFERVERPERSERPQRRPRVSSDYEPYEPPPVARSKGGSATHHPVSRVRYRSTDDGESRTEHRTRPRPSRHSAPESWEYDV